METRVDGSIILSLKALHQWEGGEEGVFPAKLIGRAFGRRTFALPPPATLVMRN